MKSIYFFTVLVIFANISLSKLYSQNRECLDINQIRAGINADGTLFNDFDKQESLFEVPSGSGKSMIYAANLWIAGFDQQGDLHAAAQTYKQGNSSDFWAGPVAKNYVSHYDYKYNRVWKINQVEIEEHKNDFNRKSYLMPEVIKNWPAMGSKINGEAEYLAPFIDINNNKLYDPENGDYPLIFGDQAIYFIYNDTRDFHTETNASKMGVEIHGMAYAFDGNSNYAFDNTVFVNYRIINRSANNYKNVFIGLWVDFDLGYSYDDFTGSDSSRSMYFVYNGNNNDPIYGYKPPVLGVRIMNNKLSSYTSYDNDWSLKGNPTEALHYYYYLDGRYKNGQRIDSTNKFQYPGTTRYTSGFTATDVRGIGSYGPINLLSGKSECMDYAFTYARDPNNDFLGNIETLNYLSDEVTTYYKNMPLGCNCKTLGILSNKIDQKINVFPSSFENYIKIEIPEGFSSNYTLEIYSSEGKIVYCEKFSKSELLLNLDLSSLKKGLYILRITGSENVYYQKITKL